MNFLAGIGWLLAVPILVIVAIIVVVYVRARYKIADANEAIVITGGKGEPKILVGGGAFVPPFRKAEFFDLGLMTVTSTNEATQTTTMINVVVEWTAQLRADTSRDEDGRLNESLRNAILGFTNYEGRIADSLQQTLEGEVRAVIATLTPEELVRDKAGFAEKVNTGVRDSMADLGFKLVSLNIGKISDPNGYYDHLSAKDREEKRTIASNLTADADQSIAIRAAEADEAAKRAEQKRDLAVAEQRRELTLRNAAIQAETDLAQADAAIAGQLQTELRNQELAARQGEVAVVREKQAQAAAAARREVEVTEAETAKQKREIEAEAEAEALKRTAQGEAEAAAIKAQGESDAINRTTEAKARQIRETGLAEAEVARAKGEAEAAARQALGEAEANAQLLMAQALAAEDGANLKVTLAEVEANARVIISTQVGQAMAEIGKNAKFVDLGGANGEGGDLMTRVLGNLPRLLAQADVSSDSLLDTTLGGAVGGLVASIRDGKEPAVVTSVPEPVSTPTVAAVGEVASVEQEASLSTAEPFTTEAPSVPADVEASVAVAPGDTVEPDFTVESVEPNDTEPVTDADAEKLITRDSIMKFIETVDGTTSLEDVTAHFGVDQKTLEKIMRREFTPKELIKLTIKLGAELGKKK